MQTWERSSRVAAPPRRLRCHRPHSDLRGTRSSSGPAHVHGYEERARNPAVRLRSREGGARAPQHPPRPAARALRVKPTDEGRDRPIPFPDGALRDAAGTPQVGTASARRQARCLRPAEPTPLHLTPANEPRGDGRDETALRHSMDAPRVAERKTRARARPKRNVYVTSARFVIVRRQTAARQKRTRHERYRDPKWTRPQTSPAVRRPADNPQ
jgi:hypothetical protein